MSLRLAGSARRQYHQALAYIRQDDPAAARRFHDRVRASLERLLTFPMAGRVVPELPDSPHREVVVAPHRFFYRVAGPDILIVAMWHRAQLPQAPP